MTRLLLIVSIFFIWCLSAQAQTPCTAPGQNPGTAFPVCGTTSFVQTNVPQCGGRRLPVPGCRNGSYSDRNPFWYKFTCYKTGTLGFVITPNNPTTSDYDWQLFDITGRDPDDVYNDQSLVITGNWSATYGNTGASNTGVDRIECASDPAENKPTFSTMPQIIEGHTYLLFVSHFTASGAGYSLSFGGGTGIITDPVIPKLKTIDANCDGDVIRVKLDKRVRCNSIAADGSDFGLSNTGAVPITITKATATDCSQQFDADYIELQLSGPLVPGTYDVFVKRGTDNNTLLDHCDNPVTEGQTLPVTIVPKTPTPMDSLVPPTCAPKQLKLVFKKPMLCSSIAADGSDFIVNGTYTIAATAASGVNCTNGLTQEILVTLAKPMEDGGNFQIVLRRGSDGNSIINECLMETAPGSALPFTLQDTVTAAFSYTIGYGCETDTINFMHAGANGVNSWEWNLDDGQSSTLQNPQGLYTVFNQKQIELIVTNGFCSDTITKSILLDNTIKADFTVIEDNCPNEPIQFTSAAQGIQLTHAWTFGDGNTATDADPLHTYLNPGRETAYSVRYTVTDRWGCEQSIQKPIRIYPSCYIAVPNAFTPNGDNLNDVMRPMNAIKAEGLEFSIYNRWGQQVYTTKDWKKGWDGKFNGKLQPSAVYIWTLRYVNRDTKKKVEDKGTFVLIR
jgi:gliding motility-associated-like protein